MDRSWSIVVFGHLAQEGVLVKSCDAKSTGVFEAHDLSSMTSGELLAALGGIGFVGGR